MFIRLSIMPFLNRVHEGEWKALFDGKTLDGWDLRSGGDQSKATVRVRKGEIHIESPGPNVWLSHEKSYEDFELRLEAKMPGRDYNSGIGFRCRGKTRKPNGYQCEVDRYKSGMIYSIGSGWLWPGSKRARNEYRADPYRIGAWNEYRIRAEGNHIRIWINGEKTAEVRDEEFEEGFVSLQHHGGGHVYKFRRIRLREIRK